MHQLPSIVVPSIKYTRFVTENRDLKFLPKPEQILNGLKVPSNISIRQFGGEGALNRFHEDSALRGIFSVIIDPCTADSDFGQYRLFARFIPRPNLDNSQTVREEPLKAWVLCTFNFAKPQPTDPRSRRSQLCADYADFYRKAMRVLGKKLK